MVLCCSLILCSRDKEALKVFFCCAELKQALCFHYLIRSNTAFPAVLFAHYSPEKFQVSHRKLKLLPTRTSFPASYPCFSPSLTAALLFPFHEEGAVGTTIRD
ncbi:hypothetical protein QOT17_025348 [Balamuthia mandrillaris]